MADPVIAEMYLGLVVGAAGLAAAGVKAMGEVYAHEDQSHISSRWRPSLVVLALTVTGGAGLTAYGHGVMSMRDRLHNSSQSLCNICSSSTTLARSIGPDIQ